MSNSRSPSGRATSGARSQTPRSPASACARSPMHCRSSCRGAWPSARRSRAPWWRGRRCCCSTSRLAPSTPSRALVCRTISSTSGAPISGGMGQRAAIARALVARPAVLLLDEPFSALDAFTRFGLQDHLLDIWRADQPTMLFVTHDIEEALVLSDRVVVMRAKPGRIHAQYRIDMPRPRRRTEAQLQSWKERILEDLDLAQKGADAEPEFAI